MKQDFVLSIIIPKKDKQKRSWQQLKKGNNVLLIIHNVK